MEPILLLGNNRGREYQAHSIDKYRASGARVSGLDKRQRLLQQPGYRVPYDGLRGIYPYLHELHSGPLYHQVYGSTEAYVNEEGKVISTDDLRPGDIIHFGEQVSVFYREAGVPGVLDKDDERIA